MGSAKPRRRLIVNADDFGHSAAINRAVIEAHTEGILTSASLMVNGDAFEEAIELGRAHPKLGVGLHLTLCRGRATLSWNEIPALVDKDGLFRTSPIAAGLKYFFSSPAREQLRNEIRAQFEKFTRTGLRLDHVNGHLHLHMHPTVFALLLPELKNRRTAVRLMKDPISVDWSLGRGRHVYRITHSLIFRALSGKARCALRREEIRHTEHVFGLLEDSRVTEEYILKLLPRLPDGDSELYSHPSLAEFRHEYQALVSPQVKAAIAENGIDLIRYQDL